MPTDSTPRGDEMVRRLPERRFPEPKPQADDEDAELGRPPLRKDVPDDGSATDQEERNA